MTDVNQAGDGTTPGWAALPVRPGKIIAVHLSYASRADQRGRRPSAPSYFFEPSSSLATSGGEIVRPLGTELLAFEGEVALVIGERARRVPFDEAWDHVASVTAANDFGLYDLRANDRGSNVQGRRRLHPGRPRAHRRPPRRPGRAARAPGSTASSRRRTRPRA
jgi:5-oxopent-3-ene-1,2,5-tricarboxylate decarboxylase/2-hydroxyhepta-2,4-diene-1,7-dioate isomerase